MIDIDEIERQLAAALTAGTDTAPVRAKLKAARKTEAEAAQSAAQLAAEAAAQAKEAREQRLSTRAGELARQAALRVFEQTLVSMPSAQDVAAETFLSTAYQVAMAEEDAGTMRDKASEAAAHLANLNARLAAIEEARGVIVQQRLRGQASDTDGMRLAELDADRDGLGALIFPAKQAAGTAAKTAAEASGRASNTLVHLAMEETSVRKHRLIQAADALCGALLDVLGGLDEIVGGGRPGWFPADALVDRLYKLKLIGQSIRRVG